jgi:hypothetical protein
MLASRGMLSITIGISPTAALEETNKELQK